MSIFRSLKTRLRADRNTLLGMDSKGVAMVEFAITLPVMLTLYLGCVQVCDVVSVYRKATTTARTIADLTSQQTQVTDGTLQDIMSASSQVMAPHSPAKLNMVITQVSVSSTGVATVDWSGKSGPDAVADTTGATYTLPTGVAVNGTSIIVARIRYNYLADIGGFLHTDIPLADTIYMYPRSIGSISKV